MAELSVLTTLSEEDRAAIVREVVEAIRPLLADRSGHLVDGDDLAEMLSISRPSVDRMRADGRIPSVKLGRRRLYRPGAVIEALERQGNAVDN